MLARTPLKDLMISWLETKDPAERYDWGYPDSCACGQLAKHLGRETEWWLSLGAEDGGNREWRVLDGIALGNEDEYWNCDHTFGRLLERLRETA